MDATGAITALLGLYSLNKLWKAFVATTLLFKITKHPDAPI